jgi:hypothetical protein
MHNPWRAFGDDFPDWEIKRVRLPDGVNGETDVDTCTIYIDDRLDQAERRSTLAHEAIHAAKRHRECNEWDELAVELAAAQILLPLDRLLYVLPWATTVVEAAEELWVDPDLLWARLDHLHPIEDAAIRRAFANRDNED